jgi:uracil-DNA glycosylase family 4
MDQTQQTDLTTEYSRLVSIIKCHVEEQIEMGFPDLPVSGKPGKHKEPGSPVAYESMEDIRAAIENCRACPLYKTRTNIVFGTGNEQARLVFVGEAPGSDEDKQGQPFVGRAGQKLTQIIEAIGLSRQEVYIANVLKCRPPGNRNPLPDEIKACEPYLIAQLRLIKPRVICALGTFAAQTLLRTTQSISRLRGRFHTYHGIKLMPTYHPAYLLRNPKFKRNVWEDVQKVRAEYDRE